MNHSIHRSFFRSAFFFVLRQHSFLSPSLFVLLSFFLCGSFSHFFLPRTFQCDFLLALRLLFNFLSPLPSHLFLFLSVAHCASLHEPCVCFSSSLLLTVSLHFSISLSFRLCCSFSFSFLSSVCRAWPPPQAKRWEQQKKTRQAIWPLLLCRSERPLSQCESARFFVCIVERRFIAFVYLLRLFFFHLLSPFFSFWCFRGFSFVHRLVVLRSPPFPLRALSLPPSARAVRSFALCSTDRKSVV